MAVKQLEEISSKGSHRSQKVINALILLSTDAGEYQAQRCNYENVANVLNTSLKKIERVKKRFVEEGLEIALEGHKSTRNYIKKTDGDFEAHLVALSCSNPPEGRCRWTLRLLANKAVELEYTDSISHETVRQLLKKTKLSHGGKRGG